MFLSEGKDTIRTPLPAYELNNLSYRTKEIFKDLLNTITCESADVQSMFNAFDCIVLDYNEAYRELEKFYEEERYMQKIYGTAPRGSEICLITKLVENEHIIEDELKIGEDGQFTLLIGKKELDKNDKRTIRYFNVFYNNRIITNREFMNEAQEWYSYFDEEQDKWVIPEDEPCYGYREQFEEVLNKYADKEYAFFYNSITDEIHCYFDKKNSPTIWLRQYGTDRITNQINFDKTIEFSTLDFKGYDCFEQMEATAQVIEHFEDEYSEQ